MPDPSYPNNFLNARILGGVTVPVPLREENGYQLEIEEFEKRLTPNTKMIVLTNPNNPTTTVMRRESLEKLAQFAVKNDLIVVCDQAFEDSVYDGVEFVTLASLPGMWERTVTVCSISKGMAAQRLPGGLHRGGRPHHGCVLWQRRKRDRSHQHRLSTGSHCCVEGCLFPEEYNRIFDRRRKIVYEIFNSIPGVSMAMPESTFLCWVNVSRLGHRRRGQRLHHQGGQRGGERRHPVRRTRGGTPADCIRSLPGGRADGDGAGACQSRTHEAGKGEGGFLSNGREKEISG